MRTLTGIIGTSVALAGFVLAQQSWDSWWTCNHGFRHYYKDTGLADKSGKITAAKILCIRPGCNWNHVGNQVTSFLAEMQHWKTHVPDKKQQKALKIHSSIDGPHYASVEGQPSGEYALQAATTSGDASPTEVGQADVPLMLKLGEGMVLLASQKNGVCSIVMLERIGDWLMRQAEPLFSVQVGGSQCQRLWSAVIADNAARLQREGIR